MAGRWQATEGKTVAGRAAARTPKRSPSPLEPQWSPEPARYGVGVHHNVAVRATDGTVLRADIHYPTVPETGAPASGPFPVLLSITPYGKKAPPPAAQIGGGATPYLIRRGYIEVMADVRGTGASGGSFEMLGAEQVQDGVDLVNWAAQLPNSNGRVGMFGISYLAINQLLTAAAVGPDSPLKAIFPVMAANDFYRDVVTMGGVPHMRTVRAYGSLYSLLNVVNPALEFAKRGAHERPRAGGLAAVRQRGRDQRHYFRTLTADAAAGGDTAFDGPFWDAMRTGDVLPKIVQNDVAVFLIGGWHDAFQRGAPLNYVALQNTFAGRPPSAPMQPGQAVSDRVQLIMGPWYHVSDLDGLHLNALQLRWFDRWLKDSADAEVTGPPVRFQAIGSPTWFQSREYPFPEPTPTRLYLAEGGTLTHEPAADQTEATLRYAARGPISGRSLEQWSLGMSSFMLSRTGRRIRYDLDNRRLQREALTYTTAEFTEAQLIAGPVTLTVHATADTTETLWVAHLDDVSPDGVSRPLTQGALLGSHRALDPDRTWYRPDGTVLRPQHLSTRAAVEPVVPGELTRYDIEVFPTAALIERGHRLRLTLTTYDFPHLVPTKPALAMLAGGMYRVQQGGASPSSLLIPLAEPAAFQDRGVAR
ncbi:putative CocE/NonD family hydrolase [Mycobacterium frederiksbergense]|uniref:CocE/NonD family hydrolase n=1 Tax=Mycolicibacterium frederiksbergense TaxID=117567 RepID=A0ABT6KXL9_9MYCO|nr:CocE/NonD family hydrolase [Mycolicibacterium frederiksbergense]MDH6195463.1 putative CocE/NonD family hydrolase [Mycolicibacterium frederiksbergense]